MTGDPHLRALRRGRVAVLTVSDSRSLASDVSGSLAVELLEAAGHVVSHRGLVPDEPEVVRARIESWLADPACDGVVVTGGTGIAPRDRTYEAVSALIERRLDGFGELFRSLSFTEIGSAAILSRAVGGVARGRFVFSLPGSPNGVRLGLERLILPELGHLLGELERGV
jgi:molybdenum cofactor biosynthesis protein B